MLRLGAEPGEESVVYLERAQQWRRRSKDEHMFVLCAFLPDADLLNEKAGTVTTLFDCQ